MARSSADDMELKRACEAGILSKEKAPEKVVMCMRVAKGHSSGGTWAGKAGKLASRHSNMAKPRVLAVTTKQKGQKTKAFLRVLKYSNGGILEPAKVYKIKHLNKVEVASNDPSGCTFILGFDNLRSQSVSPPQWTMRNKDDRNRLLMCALNLCKEVLGGIPKVVGMDIVEMAIWAKENTTTKVAQVATKDSLFESLVLEPDSQVALENDLVSQAEEEDIEALLGTYVMAIGEAEAFSERMKRELVALESANVYALMETESVVEEVLQGLEVATICVEDMDEWLGIFNIKLRHMREDIQSEPQPLGRRFQKTKTIGANGYNPPKMPGSAQSIGNLTCGAHHPVQHGERRCSGGRAHRHGVGVIRGRAQRAVDGAG